MAYYTVNEKFIAQWTQLFEKLTFNDLYLRTKNVSDLKAHDELISILLGEEIIEQIYRQKINLTDFLARQSSVQISDDDRTRMLLFISSTQTDDLAKVNQDAVAEFGKSFKILPSYRLADKEHRWQEIMEKGREIQNGINNYWRFQSLGFARLALRFAGKIAINDIAILDQKFLAGSQLMDELAKSNMISVRNPRIAAFVMKLRDFFSELQLPESVALTDGSYDFGALSNELTAILLGMKVKMYRLKNANSQEAISSSSDFILNNIAQSLFDASISSEEEARYGVPLLPSKK